MKKDSNQKNNYGHRSRVREKFLKSLGSELHDYELLEILLFASNSRQDTKATAKKLINKFGDISSVINSDLETLQNIEGIGDAAIVQIKLVSQIIRRVLQKTLKNKVLINNWQDLINYASYLFKDLKYEAFCVLFFDKKHQLLDEDFHSFYENDSVTINPKLITKKALSLCASSVVLIHNHPSGNLQPSKQDIVTTNNISEILQKLEIKILDHLIISKEGHFSFRENCLV